MPRTDADAAELQALAQKLREERARLDEILEQVEAMARRPAEQAGSGAPAPRRQGGQLRGSVLRYGDIVSPIDESWDADA